MCILGETLEPFDDDGAIPAFGFGDTFTRDHSVFSLNTMVPASTVDITLYFHSTEGNPTEGSSLLVAIAIHLRELFSKNLVFVAAF